MKRLLLSALCISTLTFVLPSQAQTPSQAQIEQFKTLPPSEQKALAASYGIDLDSIKQTTATTSVKNETISGVRASTNARSGNQALIQVANEGTDNLTLNEEKSSESTHKTLALYGHDIFNLGANAFVPAADIPIPDNYILGPGDALVIQLYGKENTTHTLQINREGQIQFPNIGPVSLAGLSFTQAKQKIAEIVSEQMIGIKSSVTLGKLRSIRIFVLGEARLPGSYVISSLSTMTNAILASGGITKIGSLRNIQLKRSGKVITTFDLYDLLLKGDTTKDVRLLPGDVIFIPTIKKTAGISGEVKRPAIYELKNENTVGQLIQLAGGKLPTSYLAATKIERITANGEKTIIDVDASTRAGRNTKLYNSDVIQVFSTFDTVDEVVLLKGHVKRPGGFKWKEGLRFTDVVKDYTALLDGPDLHTAIIRSENPKSGRISVSVFSPSVAWKNPDSHANPTLKNRDTILLFKSKADRSTRLAGIVSEIRAQASFDEPTQTIKIQGPVHSPGEYPYFRDMSMSQLITLAGGLLESSSEIDAEITRSQYSHDHSIHEEHIAVDMRTENPTLEPGDTLRVKRIPYWNERRTVEIKGEVVSPGLYTILPDETLTQVIERAGGLTPHAYVKGTRYSRADLRELERIRLSKLKEEVKNELTSAAILDQNTQEVSPEETSNIIDSLANIETKGYLVINLEEILKKPSELDFALENGDVISVPKYKPTVTVLGEVQQTISHFYTPKASYKDYIKFSGGFKKYADKKRIYIVKANGKLIPIKGKSWFSRKGAQIEPGDTIVVPIDTPKVSKLDRIKSITSIMYEAALGFAVIDRL